MKRYHYLAICLITISPFGSGSSVFAITQSYMDEYTEMEKTQERAVLRARQLLGRQNERRETLNQKGEIFQEFQQMQSRTYQSIEDDENILTLLQQSYQAIVHKIERVQNYTHASPQQIKKLENIAQENQSEISQIKKTKEKRLKELSELCHRFQELSRPFEKRLYDIEKEESYYAVWLEEELLLRKIMES